MMRGGDVHYLWVIYYYLSKECMESFTLQYTTMLLILIQFINTNTCFYKIGMLRGVTRKVS